MRTGAGRALIVDDEPHVIAGLRRTLRREPYEVLTASDAEEAVELLRKHPIDVIVTDEGLPGVRGTELLSLVQEEWPEVVRIMLTGNTDIDVAKRAINQGQVYRFFTKPCNEFDLVFGIRNALEVRTLKRESGRMLGRLRRQRHFLETLEQDHPEILRVRRDDSGAVLIDPEELPEDVDRLLDQIRSEIEEADRLSGETEAGRR